LRSAARALPDVEDLVAIPRQRLDHAADGLRRGLIANAQSHRIRFSRDAGRLVPALLKTNVERRRERYGAIALRLKAGFVANRDAHRASIVYTRERLGALAVRAERAMDVILDRRAARFERAGQLLTAFSYRGVLARGFALVRDGGGHPLRAAAAVGAGMRLDIEFSDGRVGAVAGDARVTPQVEPTPLLRRRRRRTGSADEGQGTLF
jgi:exodeoxyribonuclease VII large subunit